MPTFIATDAWRNPASRPAITPNSPATGASVVENSSASMADGLLISQAWVRLARHTPVIIGKMFLRCFPVALKPTIVNIPPIVGPFKSLPTASTKSVAKIPLIPIFNIVAAPPSSAG